MPRSRLAVKAGSVLSVRFGTRVRRAFFRLEAIGAGQTLIRRTYDNEVALMTPVLGRIVLPRGLRGSAVVVLSADYERPVRTEGLSSADALVSEARAEFSWRVDAGLRCPNEAYPRPC